MSKSSFAAILAFFSLLALVAPLYCQKKAISIEDKRKTVKIGFSRLQESNLSQNQKTLADTIPLRLMDVLSAIDYRTISPDEAEAYRSAALLEKIMEVGLKLDEGIVKYDMKILTEKGDAETQTARKSLKGPIKASKKELEAYSTFDIKAVKVEAEKNVEWVKPSQSAKLFPYQLSGPQSFCAREDLDIVVSGSLSGSSGYAFLEIYAYHRYLGKRVFEWKTALAEDDSAAAIDEFSSLLAKALLGRETTSLLVKAAPQKAEIFVDGKYVGNAPYVSAFSLPGKHEIVVSSPGFADLAATVMLEEGKAFEKTFELKSLELGSLSLATEPAGAYIYLNAAKIGQTPLDLPVIEEPRSIRAKSDGFMDKVLVIPEGAKLPISSSLVTKEEGERNSFKKQRDRFYLSAGAFMVSLPVSVLCVGMFNQYYENLTNVNSGNYTQEQQAAAGERMGAPFYAWQTSAFASCGVSAGLLGFCVYRFVLYLKSAQ
jgi:hypothetical protein